MIYDRCPKCGKPMKFHAITVARGEWRRWVECTCGTHMSSDDAGLSVYIGDAPPPKNILARNEVYSDE